MDFAITSDSCSNTTFPSAGNCTLQATFTPSAEGARNAIIRIPSNDPGSPLYNIPLYGTGQFTLFVTKTGTGAGNVTSAPAGIDCGATCSAAFNGGTVVTLTAAAAVNSTFTGWTGGGCAGGTISPSTSQTVNYNATTSFTVTPNTGYSISSVTGCGGTLSGSIYTTGPITADCTITAAFKDTFTITTPSGPVEVKPGISLQVSTAGASNVVVDGVSIGAVNVVTFINITGPHTITW